MKIFAKRYFAWILILSLFAVPTVAQGSSKPPGEISFSFLQYLPQSISFDRVHNQFLDIAVASGAVGFLAYLLLFLSAFFMMRKYFSAKSIPFSAIALGAVFLGYAIQSLFVFDTPHSYIFFFTLLAFTSIHFQGENKVLQKTEQARTSVPDRGTHLLIIGKAIGVLFVFLLIGYLLFLNFSLFRVEIQLLHARTLLDAGERVSALYLFEKALQGPSFTEFETRFSTLHSFLYSLSQPQYENSQKELAQEMKKLIPLIEKNLKQPDFFRQQTYIYLAEAYKNLYVIERDPNYLRKGAEILAGAMEFNSQYSEFFYLAGEITMLQQKREEAMTLFSQGYELDRDLGNYDEYLGRTLIEIGEHEEGVTKLKKSIEFTKLDTHGGEEIAQRRIILLAHTYRTLGKSQELLDLYEEIGRKYRKYPEFKTQIRKFFIQPS